MSLPSASQRRAADALVHATQRDLGDVRAAWGTWATPQRIASFRAWRPSRAIVLWSLAGVAMLGLLMLLLGVTREAVRQGELRRETTALYWQANWRCNLIPHAGRRQTCLAQLRENGPPRAPRVP